MKAQQAFLHGPGDLRIEPVDLDVDNLGPHEILVETEISAFKIGTDRGNYEGASYGTEPAEYPRPVGEEKEVGSISLMSTSIQRP